MATALDLIKGALRRITAYQTGEAIAAPDANDALDTLNDLLDSWSIDKQLIFGSVENILQLQAQKSQYSIGNPTSTSLGLPPIVGYLVSGSPIIAGITTLPTLIVGAGLTDTGNVIPSGTTVLSSFQGTTTAITFSAPPTGTSGTISGWAGGAISGFITFSDSQTRNVAITVGGLATWTGALTGSPTTAASLNTTIITMSANASASPVGADTITYTIPGDFAIPRPNRITHGFTRFSQLDFSIEVTMSQSRFLEILYKKQPGPWPTVAWYNPQDPYGLINFYQTPGNAAELHLFTDTILANLTLNQTFVLPSGYSRAIKWCLAKELCAEYGYEMTDAIRVHAAESMAMIKALNALPAEQARYDRMLTRGNRPDGGWIMSGGYN